jgi:hypothetical protein
MNAEEILSDYLDFESTDTCHPQEFVDLGGGRDNVDVLRYPAQITVPPNRPATANGGHAIGGIQDAVECLSDPVLAGCFRAAAEVHTNPRH